MVSPLATLMEGRTILRFGRDSDGAARDCHPVFIVGAPRSGSTALYQALTECLDLLYIDNLASLFYRNLYFGMWLSQSVFHRRRHGCFQSEQGSTEGCGLHAPAECGDFWYRWLPREPHYIPKGQLGEVALRQIRQTIYAIIHRFRRPLVFKNLNAGQRMGMLRQITPNARFIFIRRDPVFTAQSIMEVKREKGLDARDWWSIMPENQPRLLELDGPEMAVAQVFYLERQIMMDRHLFPPEQCVDIRYEDFCRDVVGTIKRLGDYIGSGIAVKRDPAELEISLRQGQVVDDETFGRLKAACAALDWEGYDIQ
jgi:hypothetical protein